MLLDARDIDARAFAHLCRRFARHDAGFRQRFGGSQFHFEPLLETVLVAPDAAHLSAGITWNQTSISCAIARDLHSA